MSSFFLLVQTPKSSTCLTVLRRVSLGLRSWNRVIIMQGVFVKAAPLRFLSWIYSLHNYYCGAYVLGTSA